MKEELHLLRYVYYVITMIVCPHGQHWLLWNQCWLLSLLVTVGY